MICVIPALWEVGLPRSRLVGCFYILHSSKILLILRKCLHCMPDRYLGLDIGLETWLNYLMLAGRQSQSMRLAVNGPRVPPFPTLSQVNSSSLLVAGYVYCLQISKLLTRRRSESLTHKSQHILGQCACDWHICSTALQKFTAEEVV